MSVSSVVVVFMHAVTSGGIHVAGHGGVPDVIRAAATDDVPADVMVLLLLMSSLLSFLFKLMLQRVLMLGLRGIAVHGGLSCDELHVATACCAGLRGGQRASVVGHAGLCNA